ncbi:MAG: NAD-dependent deacylase [Armatimonadaceae bacterium]
MRIVFFTGAGISRESGLQTFRDSDGLWEGQAVEDVCSVEAWNRTPDRVLAFYNERRRAVRQAVPNAAHHAIAALEGSGHDVAVVTQNVDDLHERAGSTTVVHLHGEIVKSRSDRDDSTLYECPGDIYMGDRAPDGGQLRPHVVFFGETVFNYSYARSLCKRANIMVVVGTSLAVYPVAYLVQGRNARTLFLVDPDAPSLSRISGDDRKIEILRKPATEGVPEVIARIHAQAERWRMLVNE